jgi:hypothetical protein
MSGICPQFEIGKPNRRPAANSQKATQHNALRRLAKGVSGKL